MAFWLAILFGVSTAIFVMKKCWFHAIWIILFNMCISIYVAIMLSPLMIKALPKDVDMLGYHAAACVLVVAILTFIVLHIAATASLGMDSDITLPGRLEKVALPVLGFLAGYLLCSFILFLIGVTPLIDKETENIDDASRITGPLVTTPIVKTCSFVSNASMQCFVDAPGTVISGLRDVESTLTEEQQTDDPSSSEQVEDPDLQPEGKE
ncbi:MAG: CvpA family protein [Anaerohalosphaera sp.]|nr:CvpA family protein [Anaerohalosphaera sp.]